MSFCPWPSPANPFTRLIKYFWRCRAPQGGAALQQVSAWLGDCDKSGWARFAQKLGSDRRSLGCEAACQSPTSIDRERSGTKEIRRGLVLRQSGDNGSGLNTTRKLESRKAKLENA